MNQDSSSVTLDSVVVRRPLAAEWMTVPVRRERLSEDGDEWVVVLSVQVYPGVSTYVRFTCTSIEALRVHRKGRVQREFILCAVTTSHGLAIKIDKIEIDGIPYKLRL